MKKKVVVIGGGIAGLASAALLGKSGYDVTLVEKNKQLGGRARVYKEKGFTFDMGPSWYMMPDAFENFFALFGKKPSDFYTLKKLSPHYKIYFSADDSYEISDDKQKNIALFNSIEEGSGRALDTFLEDSKRIYTIAMNDLVTINYSSLFDSRLLKAIKHLPGMGLFQMYHAYIKERFSSPKLQKILEFTTVFLGGSPYNMPAFYRLIAHTDFNLHIWYPMGGMYKVIEALITLCHEYNVTIKTDESVTSIDVDDGVAKSVMTTRATYEADYVVSNADYAFSEISLLKKKYQTYDESYWKKRTYAPSAFLLYLGIKGKIENARHHTLYFDPSWEFHFDDIFESSKWPESPSYYVNIPTKTDPSVAPPGCETMIVLVPISSTLKDDDKTRQDFADQIITHFEKLTGQKISDRILVKKIYSQRDFAADYNAYSGTAFGLAHTLSQTAIFRVKNKSQKVKNLYYAGQYTNPGIGLPTSLISAEIVHSMIKNEK